MSAFSLHPQLSADSAMICDLVLCRVLLMDDARFPWLVLVPRRVDLVEFTELDELDCRLLSSEARQCALALQQIYQPHKLNLGALGNVVPQFHLHLVARYRHDARWPQPVWGCPPAEPYPIAQREARIGELQRALLPG
jgi:diadenosine tetraphosphate (Ap4A) HIT family hydrolase